MKRILAIITLLLVFALTATVFASCGGEDKNKTSASPESGNAQTESPSGISAGGNGEPVTFNWDD